MSEDKKLAVQPKESVTRSTEKRSIKVQSVDDILTKNINLNDKEIVLINRSKGKKPLYEMVLRSTSKNPTSTSPLAFTKEQLNNAVFALNSQNKGFLSFAGLNLPLNDAFSNALSKDWKISANHTIGMEETGRRNAKNLLFITSSGDETDMWSVVKKSFFDSLHIREQDLMVYMLHDSSLQSSKTAIANPVSLRPILAPSARPRGSRRLDIVARVEHRTSQEGLQFYASSSEESSVHEPLKEMVQPTEAQVFFDSQWELKEHVLSLLNNYFYNINNNQILVAGANPVVLPNPQEIKGIEKEQAAWALITEKMLIIMQNDKKPLEDRVCELLDLTFSSYEKYTKNLKPGEKPFESIPFLAPFPMLIMAVMQLQELDIVKNFFDFKIPNPTEQSKFKQFVKKVETSKKLKAMVKGIAKHLIQNDFSGDAWFTGKSFGRFVVHFTVVILERDHLMMQAFQSVIRQGMTGRNAAEKKVDIKGAVFFCKTGNTLRGGPKNTTLSEEFNNQLNQVFSSGIGIYLGLHMPYTLLDDAVTIAAQLFHKPASYNTSLGKQKLEVYCKQFNDIP